MKRWRWCLSGQLNTMGVWSNGMMLGSNPRDVGSIPTAPATLS